jgi:alcohol dehydrogenase (cytochrome c)
VVYKIDGSSGDVGRIVWRMDPKQEQQRQSRGVALWGNLVISASNGPGRVIATNKETGKVVLETAFPDIASVVITLAPLAIKDKIIVGAANSGGVPVPAAAPARHPNSAARSSKFIGTSLRRR